MSDVRALLKAKRAERGQPEKKTKTPLSSRKGKRKADVSDNIAPSANGAFAPDSPEAAKRRKVDVEMEDALPSDVAPEQSSGFPSNFFSDPSRAPPPVSDDEDDDNEADNTQPSQTQPAPPPSTIDAEWEAFQRVVISAPVHTKPVAQEVYARATVFAAPELSEEIPDGFPASAMDDRIKLQNENAAPLVTKEEEIKEPEETDAERKKRIDEEERQLLMDRLLDEERAQARLSMLLRQNNCLYQPYLSLRKRPMRESPRSRPDLSL